MADDEIMTRLKGHEKAFESLMELMPANLYYGTETNDDQWQKKKQTKEEKRKAKKAKLEPGAHKTALAVHREREAEYTRKLELEQTGEKASTQTPGTSSKRKHDDEDLPAASKKMNKKQKQESQEEASKDKKAAVAGKRKEKRQAKKEQKARKRAKKEAKKAKADEAQDDSSSSGEESDDGGADTANKEATQLNGLDIAGREADPLATNEDTEELGVAERDADSAVSDSDAPPIFDDSHQSSASSTSSIVPPTDLEPPIQKRNADKSQAEDEAEAEAQTTASRPDKIRLPEIAPEVLRARLQARLAAHRLARNADGPDGRPAQNRQELIDSRRRKEERRKQHKKELRELAKQQASSASSPPLSSADAEAARLRGGSDSPLWSPGTYPLRNNFSFGRVAFEDGASMDANLSSVREAKSKKGPQDAKTALDAAQRKNARISGLDQERKGKVQEQEMWLTAKKRAQGEKVKDDVSLLKKTLKRKEAGKKKGEKEWTERIEGVQKSQEMKQKRREDNLAKRREEKGQRGKGRFGIKNFGAKKSGPVKKRPGFEGSFKTGAKRNA